MASLLDIQNLQSKINHQEIFSDISFALEQGELCALLGPSGCGKTTLLRTIAGFIQPSAGKITLQDKEITYDHAATRGIGFVFQDYALFPHLSVEENIAYGIHSSPEKKQRIEELVSLTGLSEFLGRYPHELSGGQQQRVALARALAPKPKLILMDEPFSNLDTDLRKNLSFSIRDMLRNQGISAILVTHDQSEAFAFGDKVGVLHKGQLEQIGTPYTLYHEPKTPFVAKFIGEGQIIPASRLDEGTIKTSFGDIHHTENIPASGNFGLLTRPDDWIISTEAGENVTIAHKKFAGTQTFYWVATDTGEKIQVAAPSHQNFNIGDSVKICPQFEHIITFPQHYI